MNQLKSKSIYAVLMVIVFLTAGCGASEPENTPTPEMPGMTMPDVPEDLDTSTTRVTDEGAFQVSVSSNLDPLELNEIHSWTIHVETPEGEGVEGAELVVDGGMPQHNHGFPTVPEVTEELGGGDYLLEGVKFSMSGWWELKLAVTSGDETDSVTFNLVLP